MKKLYQLKKVVVQKKIQINNNILGGNMEGQIIKILSNLYTVSSQRKLYECHSRGKFRKDNITPTVGD